MMEMTTRLCSGDLSTGAHVMTSHQFQEEPGEEGSVERWQQWGVQGPGSCVIQLRQADSLGVAEGRKAVQEVHNGEGVPPGRQGG